MHRHTQSAHVLACVGDNGERAMCLAPEVEVWRAPTMSKYCLLIVLIANCLLAEQAFAQDPKPLQLPEDPRATIAAMPIATPVKDGHVVKVIDDETKKPIPHADVLAWPTVQGEEFKKRSAEVFEAVQARKADFNALLVNLAATLGTRYQTNSEGMVTIPAGHNAFAVVLSGDKIGQWHDQMKGPLELSAPLYVTVQVLNSRGKPERNVEVRLADRNRAGGLQINGKTDASGICKLWISPLMRSNDLQVEAIIASKKRLAVPFQVDAIPDQPLQLQLPPCGQVRFLLYGEDERPSSTLDSARLDWPREGTTESGLFCYETASIAPTNQEPDGAMFAHVELHLDIHIIAKIKDIPNAMHFRAKGPTRERELIIVDNRVNVGPPIVRFRLLDQQGQALVNEQIGTVIYSAKWNSHHVATTDADGYLSIALQRKHPESLYVMRRSNSEGTDYRGAARIKIGELKPGKQVLADLKLEDEPVIASGTIVDSQGEPVAGLWLHGSATIVSDELGNGPSGRDSRWFEHRVCTDAQGRFAIRELAPVDNPVRLWLKNNEWADLDRIALKQGDLDKTFRAAPATQLVGQFIGDLKGTRLNVTVINRSTGDQQLATVVDGTIRVLRLPMGSYDLVFGRNSGFKLENVQSAPQGQAQDSRLQSDEWTKHFQVLTTTVTDRNNKPLSGISVYYFSRRRSNRLGTRVFTNERGVARRLMPINNASIEIKQAGYESHTFTFTKGRKDLLVQLQPIAAIDVQIMGMPELPAVVFASVSVASGAPGTNFDQSAPLIGGRTTVQPRALGKSQLRITLQPAYRKDISREVRSELLRALAMRPLTFEIIGTRKPTEPTVLKLDQDTINEINACLADVRKVLKQASR